MKSPQTERGFIRIATGDIKNDLFTALISADLNSTEYKIILSVIRKTWGWGKKSDWISYSQFQELTGKSRRSVAESIKSLVQKNILVQKTTLGVRSTYQINKSFGFWGVHKTALVQNPSTTSAENRTPPVQKTAPTKETLTKETIQKRIFDKNGNKYTPRKGTGMEEISSALVKRARELRGI